MADDKKLEHRTLPRVQEFLLLHEERTALEAGQKAAYKAQATIQYPEAPGELVRAKREARGWTLRQLSQRTGLSYSYLSKLETGSRRISGEAALILGRVLRVGVCRLFIAEARER